MTDPQDDSTQRDLAYAAKQAKDLDEAIKHLEELTEQRKDWVQCHSASTGDSNLNRDEAFLKVASVHNIAVFGFASALDHLQLFASTFDAQNPPAPFAHYSLLRASMFAAAIAQYVLHPDERTRRLRALQLTRHEYSNHYATVEETMPSAKSIRDNKVNGERLSARRESLKSLKKRNADFMRQAKSLGFTEAELKQKPKDGNVVKLACDAIEGSQASRDLSIDGDETMLAWRLASAHSHSQSWAIAPVSINKNSEKTANIRLRASSEKFCHLGYSAFLLIDNGIARFDALSGVVDSNAS